MTDYQEKQGWPGDLGPVMRQIIQAEAAVGQTPTAQKPGKKRLDRGAG